MYTAYLQTSQLISGILEDRPPDFFHGSVPKKNPSPNAERQSYPFTTYGCFRAGMGSLCDFSPIFVFWGDPMYIYIYIYIYGGFHKWRYPQKMEGLYLKIPI